MASLGETLAGAYDPMGNFTGGSTPVQYPTTGASVPASVQSSNVNDYWGALARLPVKAAMALPDLAQDYGAWRTGIPADQPYSQQAEDALMAHGLLPQRTGSEWDQKGDTVASLGSSVMPGPGEAASLAKMLGGAAGASKAILVPLGLASRVPADASKAEQMIAQGLHRQAWADTRDWRNGVAGIFRRPDDVNALETTDYAMTVARGKMQSQANKIANDGVPASSFDASTLYPYSQPLSDVVTGPAFSQVPGLKDWRIVGMPHAQNTYGFASPSKKLIAVAADDPAANGGKLFYDPSRTRNTVAHEMQHAVDEEAKNAGILVGGTGANPISFGDPSRLSSVYYQASNRASGSPDAQRLADYLRDLVYSDPKRLPFEMYQRNSGEALARVVGETAAAPTAGREQLLNVTPNVRMPLLQDGPMTSDKLHYAASTGDFERALSRIKSGTPNALRGLLPGQ